LHTVQSRAISEAHKAEMSLLAARNENERSQAAVRASEEALEASRRHARETTDMLCQKMEEVEALRLHKQADDRERSLKFQSLANPRQGRQVW
jgi:selenocysteine lyase/cysteine desulfurase